MKSCASNSSPPVSVVVQAQSLIQSTSLQCHLLSHCCICTATAAVADS
uniref:Uncharacterized protein n=1 Tax=Rhizophora mucronata TaxID=61149 RepID=A0A2P2KMY3_RHIMU